MRDKLAKLIVDSNCVTGFAGSLARYLIANGVTFAEDNNVPCKKPMTTGDRIRSMTDEELTYWFEWRSLCGHIQIEHEELCDARGVCNGCALNWLKQPCEVE